MEQKGEEEIKIEQSGVNSSENTLIKTDLLGSVKSETSNNSSSESQYQKSLNFISDQYKCILEEYGKFNIKEKDLTGIQDKLDDRHLDKRFSLTIFEDNLIITYDLEIHTTIPDGNVLLKLYKTTVEEIREKKVKISDKNIKSQISKKQGNIIEVLKKMRES